MSAPQRFFTAFASRDASTMGACYDDEARFRDPAFGELDAEQVRAMWRMLIARGTDLRIEFKRIEEDGSSAVYEWQAWYTFSGTGRPVHNIIRSRFLLRDGLIVDQRDGFGLWRWSRQALGPMGWLLGWSPWVQGKVRRSARAALRKAMQG